MTREEYGEAYLRGFEKTLRFLISRGADPHDAEEAAQAGWTRGWERLGQLKNPDLVVVWVNTIAINVFRWNLRNDSQLMKLELEPDKIPISPDLGHRHAGIDLSRIIKLCKPKIRRLLEDELFGLTNEETAQLLGISEPAARLRRMRARFEARARHEEHARLNRQHTSLERINKLY